MQTAVQNDPNLHEGYIKLGHWMTNTENPLAIDYFSAALKIDSNNAVAWQGRGNFYHLYQQNYEQARKDYNRALSLDSNHQQTLYNLATLEYETGQFKEAEKRYLQLTRLNETSTNALLGLG